MYTNINTKMHKTHESNLIFVSIQNFTNFQKLFNNNNNFHHQFTNGILNIPIHQQHVFQTSTTTINHEFLHNSTTTTHNSSISLKNTIYSHTWNLGYKFNNNNNLVINSFMYMNILSTSKTKFNIKIQISTYS